MAIEWHLRNSNTRLDSQALATRSGCRKRCRAQLCGGERLLCRERYIGATAEVAKRVSTECEGIGGMPDLEARRICWGFGWFTRFATRPAIDDSTAQPASTVPRTCQTWWVLAVEVLQPDARESPANWHEYPRRSTPQASQILPKCIRLTLTTCRRDVKQNRQSNGSRKVSWVRKLAICSSKVYRSLEWLRNRFKQSQHGRVYSSGAEDTWWPRASSHGERETKAMWRNDVDYDSKQINNATILNMHVQCRR